MNLQKQFGFSEGEFKKQISNIHIDQISCTCCKEWRSLFSHLDLDEIVNDDVERNNITEIEKKIAFFGEWRQRKAFEATYKKLVCALEAINRHNDAVIVCKILAKSLGKPIPEDLVTEGIRNDSSQKYAH